MAKVMRLRGQTGKGESGLKGASLDLLVHLPPKPESACLTVLCLSPTLLTLTGAIPHHLSLKKVNLKLQLISLLGVTRVFQSENFPDDSLTCLTGLSGHM